MSSAEHIESVRRAFEDVGAGTLSTLLELLAPDVVYTLIGGTAVSGVFRGRDAVRSRLFEPLGAALATPLRFSIQRLLADGDHVVMQATGQSTLHSGVSYNNTYCMVFRFAGRQVSEVTEYLDTQLVARAFGVPAERQRLLRAMDLNCWEMFRDIVRLGRGAELLETPQYYMGYGPRGTLFHNMVMLRDRVDLDVLFDQIRRFYLERGAPFSIWTRAHADAEVEAALRARGFDVFTTMPGMALLSDPGTRCEPPGLKIRPAVDDPGRRAYLEVTAAAYATYGAPPEYAEDVFAALESVCAPHLQGFVGYVDGAPVAAAAVYITHGVAGIGWVGTQPARRGHGYAEAVTWAAIREGFRRGAAFANLQASPMGRPIYERMGFITPTEYRVLFGTV
jgi:ketosteroid isomerase-like protein/GNAT superfamily N-acetyltransferase